MSQRLEQIQKEEQVQQLSAIQIAMAHLLELPLMDLQERVRNEMDDNEALEEADNSQTTDDVQERMEQDDATTDAETSRQEEIDAIADYLNADDVPDYLLRQQTCRDEAREIQLSAVEDAYEELHRQMSEHDLTEHEIQVMEYLIGSLDEDGYLRKNLETLADEMAIYHGVDTSTTEIESILAILQTFEPHGIGARSLQECLRIQVANPDNRSLYKETALRLIDTCWADFVAHHWDAVRRRLKVDQATLDQTILLLKHLNPKPGSALGTTNALEAPTIVPDFYVHVDNNGIPSVILNNGDVPELRISRAFRDTLREYGAYRNKLNQQQTDELIYARRKVNDAQLFIELIRRRRLTLLSVMQSIVQLQADFFVNDDDEALLVPMKLKDVAERANVDISTVSRVTGSKYVQTAYGVYPLKHFFSSQFMTADGESLSSRQAKATLREVVRTEDKRHPLNDESIAAVMKEQGYPISRRTVVKYRDQLGIPPARLRKV